MRASVGITLFPDDGVDLEEVIRQAVPAKMGFSDIAAGNLIGTVCTSPCSTSA
jgi:hypothetical protein